jgi:putative FmdB family regulatory protein
MPLYEYECDAGHRFEKIRKFSDPPVETCPKCGAAVHKLQSAPAFHLKGTGWYLTDYAKKEPAPAAKTESEAKEAKDGAKTEKSEKPEKAAKPEKSEKTEKSEKSEKPEKSDKPAKSEKTAAS